jgi:hypothetical protein
MAKDFIGMDEYCGDTGSIGIKMKVDSYNVKQYEGERFVDDVEVLEYQGEYSLCYSPKYRANVLILTKELLLVALFTYENVGAAMQQLRNGLKFPFVSCYSSTLGGRENISILLCVSEDKKENWPNDILENSKYRRFDIFNTGEVKNFTCGDGLKYMRKFKGKSLEHIIEKINKSKTM